LCPCERERRFAAVLEKAMLPGYADKTLSNFDASRQSGAHRVVSDWVQKPDGWLYLCGGPGAGKTHLAVGAARHLLERSNVAVWSYPALLEHNRGNDGRDRLGKLVRAPVLVLDDLGANRWTDWALETTFLLFDGRYNHRLPMIVTSNVALEDLAAIPGLDRVASRINEMAVAVKMGPGDYRSEIARRRHAELTQRQGGAN
jgi:DNA replication protein DnaC